MQIRTAEGTRLAGFSVVEKSVAAASSLRTTEAYARPRLLTALSPAFDAFVHELRYRTRVAAGRRPIVGTLASEVAEDELSVEKLEAERLANARGER